jgi:hypothetical protein
LRAPPAKLRQDPPFPTTPYLPTAPHTAHRPPPPHTGQCPHARLSPGVVFVLHFSLSPPPAPLPDPPAPKSQVTPTSFSCRAFPHHFAPFTIPVISVITVPPSLSQPSQTPPCSTPYPLLGDQTGRPSVRPLSLGCSLDHPPRGAGAGAARLPRKGREPHVSL